MRKYLACLAAAAMAVGPVAASAQSASALSLASASASMEMGANYFQGEDSNVGGGSTAVILGVVLVILIGLAAVSGNGDPIDNTPASP